MGLEEPLPSKVPASRAAFTRPVMIRNTRGLHARASVKFVNCARQFDADVTVSRCGESVGGESIMGLLMLAACKDCEIEISARGAEAEAAVDALVELVKSRFGEE
jgi:phosphocarrier protein